MLSDSISAVTCRLDTVTPLNLGCITRLDFECDDNDDDGDRLLLIVDDTKYSTRPHVLGTGKCMHCAASFALIVMRIIRGKV
jgi:hypothetical protein